MVFWGLCKMSTRPCARTRLPSAADPSLSRHSNHCDMSRAELNTFPDPMNDPQCLQQIKKTKDAGGLGHWRELSAPPLQPTQTHIFELCLLFPSVFSYLLLEIKKIPLEYHPNLCKCNLIFSLDLL